MPVRTLLLVFRALAHLHLDLYGRLVTEWLSSEKSALGEGGPESGEDFEEIPGAKKLGARAKW